jgi:hypothetical protein
MRYFLLAIRRRKTAGVIRQLPGVITRENDAGKLVSGRNKG